MTVGVGFAGAVQAASFSGTIESDAATESSTVDQYFVDVDTAGIVTFAANAISGSLDPFVRLYTDDGFLDVSDLIAFNDDGGPGFNSLLNINLGIGSYVLTFGDFFLEANAVGPTQLDDDSPEGGDYTLDITGATVTRILEGNLDGTFTETSFVAEAVPEPASMLGLLAIGAVAAGGVLKKKAA